MKAYLIAGEASGDKLGAALIAGLKGMVPALNLAGVGGPLMQSHGLVSLFPMDELSVMGLAEVLPKYAHFKRRIRETADDVLGARPDVLITIDSPDFCHRVAKLVRAANPKIRIVHYVAPSVWAWRRGRAKKMAGHVDQVLTLLPFEPPYMQAVGIRADFVGHPIAAEPKPSALDIAAFRDDHDLGGQQVILVLPGSRRNEVERLAPIFGDALGHILRDHADLRVVVPAASGVSDLVIEIAEHWPGRPIVLDANAMPPEQVQKQKRTVFKLADVAIAASGTVSLELAAARTPMVIAYRLNWVSWQILSRMVRLSTVTLVNLLSGRNTVPEFLGPKCTAPAIADAVKALLEDEFRREAQISAMVDCMQELGEGGKDPGIRAAEAVMDGLKA